MFMNLVMDINFWQTCEHVVVFGLCWLVSERASGMVMLHSLQRLGLRQTGVKCWNPVAVKWPCMV